MNGLKHLRMKIGKLFTFFLFDRFNHEPPNYGREWVENNFLPNLIFDLCSA
jgi:hypothetical protein